jgi:hypothetical protein
MLSSGSAVHDLSDNECFSPSADTIGRISSPGGMHYVGSLLFSIWACIYCTSSQLLVALDTIVIGLNTNPSPAGYKADESKEISSRSLGPSLGRSFEKGKTFLSNITSREM